VSRTASTAELIRSTLDERELVYQNPQPAAFFVTLPGTKKLQTNCWLIVGRHGLLVEAFVCRRPDEAHETSIDSSCAATPSSTGCTTPSTRSATST
jgi:hypothetical protein